jgi:hypothetical protein
MAKRKPTIKNDKKRKPAKSPGKITLKDYKDISKGAIAPLLEGIDPLGDTGRKWEGIKARVDYKVLQLEKKAKEPPKIKTPVKYMCLSCNEIHTKRDTVYQCPSCHSPNIEVFTG